jgi:dipeptidyl aminopeptidase/acylaminoacyl peptidase
MPKKQTLPYGTWPSRITPELTGDLREFSELSWSEDGRLLWVERHSNHSSLMAWDPARREIQGLSGDINVSGGIMYGGGSYTVWGDQVVFIGKGSSQLYLISGGSSAPVLMASTPYLKSLPTISPISNDLVYIESDGKNDSIKITDYTLTREHQTLDSRFDFYNYLRWHPQGNQLAWVSWDHPHLPWDSSYLHLGTLKGSSPEKLQLEQDLIISGGEDISILQPEFSPDGSSLVYISDQSGWWQLYIYDLQTGLSRRLTEKQAEHGLPPWVQDQRSFAFSSLGNKIYFLRNREGFRSLWSHEIKTQIETRIELDEDFTWLEGLVVSPQNDQIALVASGADLPPRLIIAAPDGKTRIIRDSSSPEIAREQFSLPEPITWAGKDGEDIHGLFYQPNNPDYQGTGKVPLLIIIHSGPTRQKYAEFQPRTQYFTSRGYAVLEANYRGSTGYGRDYWQALKGQWGILEVDDIYQAANALSRKGLIDKNRIALLGSSSGGLTVFQILVKYPGVFKAGISLYGIVNHLTLLENPPKFERYYSEWLIGAYPECAQLYKDRSPVFFAENLEDPVIIFHGGQDPIVPQDQAEQIVNALKENQIAYEYHLYPDEGHSFKKAENVSDFYQKAEAFLRKYVINYKKHSDQGTKEHQ